MKTYDIAVVGGGASGLCAAISAAKTNRNLKILIIERMKRVGKKILATGNGRCNITNLNAQNHSYHNLKFASFALNQYSVETTLAFFKSIGLLTVSDSEGRVYPMSNTAASVLDVLRFEAEGMKIETLCETSVKEISFTNGKYVINKSIVAEKVIFAAGGKASPSQGSDGSGLKVLENIGYKITPLLPSLVQIKTKTDTIKSLKGIKAKAKISIFIDDKQKCFTSGELLFTDFGISGIAAMEVSRGVSHHFLTDSRENYESVCEAVIDFSPTIGQNEIVELINGVLKQNPNISVENILIGIVPKAISAVICRAAGIMDFTKSIKTLSKKNIADIAKSTKCFRLPIVGTKGFDSAQVTAGGVSVEQFNNKTLESSKHKGLYCCGEILDVDAGCGGFNLQWAWSSGMLAGESAAK